MASMKVLGGDFGKGNGTYAFGGLSLPDPASNWGGQVSIPCSFLEEVAIATEDSVKKFGGAAGWGAVGALALGPVGLLAGVILGGNKKDVTFVARLRDGKKFLATVDSKTYAKILGATM